MNEIVIPKSKPIRFLVTVLAFQFALCFTIFFDFSIAQSIVGFLYLTFILGFVVLKILRVDKLNIIETILLSVGLSISLLMLIGLAVSELGPLVGIQQPLAPTPLILVISGFVLLGAVVHYLKNTKNQHSNAITTKTLLKSSLLMMPTILSVIGTFWANITGNSSVLLLMILVVAVVFALSVLSNRLMPSRYYTLIVLSIALALLFHSSLISRYIVAFASDVPIEYAVFTTTKNVAYWNHTNPYFGDLLYGRYYSMLSITILPTFFSCILNLDSTLLFKTIYPLIFAFVPLCLYQIWQTYIGKKYALIATFLLMAQQAFYMEMVGLNRQIIAELFFVLLLLVVLNKKMKPFGTWALFIIFSFGLITSHYALSEIFLFFVFATFAYLYITKQATRKVTPFMIGFFSVTMFFWYIYTGRSAGFESILETGNYVLSQFGDFLNPAARGRTVLLGLGLESASTIWNVISRAFAYGTQLLIIIGFVGLITKRVRSYFDKDYLMFTFIAMAFLGALIIVPGLANTLNMTRFYHILLIFLAPLCVLGAEFLVNLFSKRKERLVSVLLLAVLVPYFLFQTNFVYEVTGDDSWSVPFSRYRMEPSRLYGHFGYIDAYSAFGAQWMANAIDPARTQVYADYAATYSVLASYGMLYASGVVELSNVTTVVSGGTVYLDTLNVNDGTVMSSLTWNTSEICPVFVDLSTIYSNGNCQIYKNTG